MKSLILKYWFYIIFIPPVWYSCQDCIDCGPAQNSPFVNIRFFNIDSLVKVENTLTVLQDSLDRINEAELAGDTTLTEEKNDLENSINLYTQVKKDINDGRIRIDEVLGKNGEGPLLFRDLLTHDSLTVFQFPLDMNADESSFIIRIREDLNEISFKYDREIGQGGDFIIMRMYDMEVYEHTFDSVKLICNKNICTSNETTFRIYF